LKRLSVSGTPIHRRACAKGLADLPDETVVDGEVVALDPGGRPSFNAPQNGSAGTTIIYYVFDVMILAGRNVMGETFRGRDSHGGRWSGDHS
jgi:ATP-dependent DNA ligase